MFQTTKPQTRTVSPTYIHRLWYLSTSFEAMNIIIQSQLDRVEMALNTLIESIASYNPSIPAANALLAADDDLNKGLKQCMYKCSRSWKTVLRDFFFYANLTSQQYQPTNVITPASSPFAPPLISKTHPLPTLSRALPLRAQICSLLHHLYRKKMRATSPTMSSSIMQSV